MSLCATIVRRWTGPIRASGLGLLLPICALGALPVALELRRARIPSGTVISFVLVAPLLNPVSIVYGLSHVEPLTLLYYSRRNPDESGREVRQ